MRTLEQLIELYRTDPESSFCKLSYAVRIKHERLLARISREHGNISLRNVRGRNLIAWHNGWLGENKVAMAHSLISRLRVVFRFGAVMLEDGECERLTNLLRDMRFEKKTTPREQSISSEQAKAIRVKARSCYGWPSIALAQALQYELLLNQKDVIGEWVPIAANGTSGIRRERQKGKEKILEKWLPGLCWEYIDENLVLRYAVRKMRRPVEFDLRAARMVMEELALDSKTPIPKLTRSRLPLSGPMITNEINALPWSTAEFRRKWRIVANRVGIPKHIANRDSGKHVYLGLRSNVPPNPQARY
jgi:hypothetical protein